MKKYISIIVFFLLAMIPATSEAAEASLFLSSGSGAYQVGKSYTTRVVINSGGNDINAAESIISYDPKYLKIEKITKNKSIFELWTTEPSFSNTLGTLTFGGGLPGKFRNSAGLIFNITFRPLKNGTTTVAYSDSSMILKADGEGLNIFSQPNKNHFIFGSYSTVSAAKSLTNRFSGSILLQVEDSGKAWYVYPVDNKRYYLGRPEDAFNLMRKLGLGTTHNYITTYQNRTFPKLVSGKILLDVEDSGKAYYINPDDRKAYYLGRPADAFQVMRQLGKGIGNVDINKIPDWAV